MKKTELCTNYIETNYCRHGEDCCFAHSLEELVPKTHLPSNYKTKLCQQFQEEGCCLFGQRCQFLHSIYDLTNRKLNYTLGLKEEARLTY